MTSIVVPSPNNAWGNAVINAIGPIQVYTGSGQIRPPVQVGAAGSSDNIAYVYDAVALSLASLTWTSEVVTATTAAPHGLTGTFEVIIMGVVPTGYNGTFTATVTGASTFTYPLTSNPGLETSTGSYLDLSAQTPLTLYPMSFTGAMSAVMGPNFSNGLFVNMVGTTAGTIAISWV
jgi:hypothetical protein